MCSTINQYNKYELTENWESLSKERGSLFCANRFVIERGENKTFYPKIMARGKGDVGSE